MKIQYAMPLALLTFFVSATTITAEELILRPEKIVATRNGRIPQAPRVSPDGKSVIYENYAKDKVTLWYAAANGTNSACLTCGQGLSIENGYWHPSGKYLLMNELPEGNTKEKGIYVASFKKGRLGPMKLIAQGARPQFSRPAGHVVFFETTVNQDGRASNVLAYQILGRDPLNPLENMRLELRGPIQQLNQNADVSHPSLAPDGTTIVFAARTVNLEASGGYEGGLVMNDTDRQKVYKLWKALIPVDKKMINNALKGFYHDSTSAIGNQSGLTLKSFEANLSAKAFYLSSPTIVPGYNDWHLFLAWTLGLLDMLDSKYDSAIQELIFPRLWTTDVFGAPITPLVKDMSSTPLPQKWPTVSHDGRFVVFEAGLYTNRHIYLVAKKGDAWTDKAIKITEIGTYNSSPEIDPTGEWLYFESNRDGSKGIWRAKLNWPEIKKQLAL